MDTKPLEGALHESLKVKSNSNNEYPFTVGESYFIRTVTYHLTGKVNQIKGKFLILEEAAWIADSGRFMQAINDGTLGEVEPIKVVAIVNIDTITDAFPWMHELPRDQK